MEVRLGSAVLRRMEEDPSEDGGFPQDVVTAFRKRMQMLRAVLDERELYQLKALRFEKLKGNRSHQRSIRLNDQWRLILEFHKAPKKAVHVMNIEDYH